MTSVALIMAIRRDAGLACLAISSTGKPGQLFNAKRQAAMRSGNADLLRLLEVGRHEILVLDEGDPADLAWLREQIRAAMPDVNFL